MNETAADYSAFVGPEASSEGELSQLSKLAEQQAETEAEVTRLEAELNKARERYRDLAERQVPELMDKIGLEKFKTTSGLVIDVAETIRASIPKALQQRAFAWLRENNHAAMIKRIVSVEFGKGEDERANELLQRLAEVDHLEPDDKSSVHPSTLAAFVRAKLSEGEEVPLDLFGVHRQRVAKIKS